MLRARSRPYRGILVDGQDAGIEEGFIAKNAMENITSLRLLAEDVLRG